MTCDQHDELESSVAAYVLDAADAQEGEVARAHIEGCASCRELARRLTRAAVALPLAADEVKPPERLRSRIMAAAEATPPVRSSPVSPTRVLAMARAARRSIDPTRPSRGLRWALTAVAAVILLAGLAAIGALIFQLSQQLDQQSRRVEQLTSDLTKAKTVATPGPVYHTLSGTGPLAGASGAVTSQPDKPGIIFDFNGLPQLPPGKVYEVWLIDGKGNASRVGIFRPDVFGSYRIVSADRSLSGVAVVAVTIENGPNGVDKPTQTPPLAGKVS